MIFINFHMEIYKDHERDDLSLEMQERKENFYEDCILPKMYEVSQWGELLVAISQQYPTGTLVLEMVNDCPRMVLEVEEHEMSYQDRQFLQSLSHPPVGPQGIGVSEEVYQEMRSRRWLMESGMG